MDILHNAPDLPRLGIERWNSADGPPAEAALRTRLSARGYPCEVMDDVPVVSIDAMRAE